jgi:hypothetical protein
MRRLFSALIGGWPVLTGRVQRIAAPGKWRVWRDDAGLHVEVRLCRADPALEAALRETERD